MTRKAAVLLLSLTVPLALTDRNISRKRRAQRRALLGHVRSVSQAQSALAEVGESTEPAVIPDASGILISKKAVDASLTDVGTALQKANKGAVKALTGAVAWRTASAKIPRQVADIHEITRTNVWDALQNIAPKIAGTEQAAMVALLKDVKEDVDRQMTVDDPDNLISNGNDGVVTNKMKETQEKLSRTLADLETLAKQNLKGKVGEHVAGTTSLAEASSDELAVQPAEGIMGSLAEASNDELAKKPSEEDKGSLAEASGGEYTGKLTDGDQVSLAEASSVELAKKMAEDDKGSLAEVVLQASSDELATKPAEDAMGSLAEASSN